MIARLALLAAAGALLSSTQAGAHPAPATQHPHNAVAGQADQQVAAAKRKRHRRAGCGKFCRQAGGFGAPPGPTKHPVVVKRQTARVGARGIVGVRARCTLHKRCVGAILLDGHVSYGRADLRIPAGKTRTVYVAVPAKGIRYLEKHGHDRGVYSTVPLKGNQPVSFGRRLTLLPHN